MNILVANDDGVFTEAVKILVEELSDIGTIYVVGPKEQQSGASQSITMNKVMKLEPYHIPFAKEAYSMTGSPADCVKMGIQLFASKGINIDLVVSGINYGGNVGSDVLYSGTVGAAREGLMSGVMSIALSLDNHQGGDFKFAAKKAKEIIKSIHKEAFVEPRYMINVNFPDLPSNEIKGFKTVKLGIRKYGEWFKKTELQQGEVEVVYGGEIVKQYLDDELLISTDVEAVDNGYIAITPLNYDTTDYEKLKEMGDYYDRKTF